ncbi:type VII secretion-associated serine protease mycosin, partial [Streptomyces spongiae]|uniref:type VII secretion-associated serine protease mycosin n=1 Tax=Streptomyces spongiae TaxID=565072 RepID=UPI001D134C2A
MKIKRVWSTTGVVALTGALLLNSAPTASADYVRDQQWVLDVFSMKKTWAETQGEGVTVAVVDTGVDGDHPDMTGQVLTGKDYTSGGNAREDIAGHGTRVASLVAGHGHGSGNASGMVGLAPKAKILPLRTMQTKHDKNPEELWAEAVRYAADRGAKVINLSFANEYGQTGPLGQKAIAYAQSKDVVVVAGTGNNGGDVGYPAALPGVVAVGAVDKNANIWSSSNTGKQVALTAPGVRILAADPTRSPEYSVADGTSDATAYVSATAALVRAKYPDLTAGQVINRLIKSASFLGHKGLKAPNEEYGYGIIRPYQAVTMDIPKGPEANPLGRIQLADEVTAGDDSAASQSENEKGSSSMGFIALAVGVIGLGVVVAAVTVFAVTRSRRTSGNGGPVSGMPPQNMGYPPQQPMYPTAQQPYPTAAPNQGYP